MQSYYFDYNATTPVAPEVFEAMKPFLTEHFGNPSSLHHLGRVSAQALREARRNVASLLGAYEESEVIFTSGGTESNNAALRSALVLSPGKKKVVTSAVEHSSVFKLCCQLEKEGYRVQWLGVDSQGGLDWNELRSALTEDTAVVSLMTANNETGVLFPVEKVGEMVKERGILLHVDAVQAVGKFSIDLKKSSIDFLSLSAHKFYGPKGIGALYVRKAARFQPLIFGGVQERGRRAGTENVPGIVGLGAACQLVQKDLAEEIHKPALLRDKFEEKIFEKNSGVFVNGHKTQRLQNTSNLRFEKVDGEALLFALDQKGICASSGSACMSGSQEPSRVLKAMGLSDEEANSSLRFSFGRYTTDAEIEEGVKVLTETVARLRTIPLGEQHSHSVNP
jgi:cysteine desulfurase